VVQASPECGESRRHLLARACARIRGAVQADGGSFKATQINGQISLPHLRAGRDVRIPGGRAACPRGSPDVQFVIFRDEEDDPSPKR
jgi:hypothetical protein